MFSSGSLDENLAIDVLILDKTGAVNVTVFGELANDLSRKANADQAAMIEEWRNWYAQS